MPLFFLAIPFPPPFSQVDAAYGVLQRTIGDRSKDFRLVLTRPSSELDSFETEAARGKVTVTGTSGVALCRGAYEYLKNQCNCFVSWEGSTVNLPKKFPDSTRRVGECPAKYRHYYNICTFGYTTAFWNWHRWRREVDWMALHGINMPLAMTGQDKIWQKVFRTYGLPQVSLDEFFSGPAFQPWHWMGNLNGHGGPTPQSWLDGQAALQKNILKAERELGMKPVVPGFSGFVPVDFDKYVPNVKLDSPTAWAGFEPTRFIDVRDPKFVEVGTRFVQEYRKEFGTDHLYLCDTFNEQNPQFPANTKLQDLAKAGQAVFDGLKGGDRDAVWIMQGWLFLNEADYWHKPEVEALLSKVPDGRMIILDLGAEGREMWREQPAMAKKGFIYCSLLNFGQNTAVGGALQDYASKQRKALTEARKPGVANLQGLGLTPEGIDENPVTFELMTDAMWSAKEIKVTDWLPGYARARYGVDLPETRRAWAALYDALYSGSFQWYRDGWRRRPGTMNNLRNIKQMQGIENAIRLMLSVATKLKGNALYQRDLVDVTKTWLAGIADRQLLMAMKNRTTKHESDFMATLMAIDRVMACRPEHRLTTWIAQARAWGKNREEADLMERNARLQISAWDYKGVLTDYANKEWAGMVADYVLPRWKAYFSANPPDANGYLQMEVNWARSTKRPVESIPGDAISVVQESFSRYRGIAEKLDSELGLAEAPGNLARGGTASDDGHTEGSAIAQKAVDGDLFTYWAASPWPRTWQLDLGSAKSVKTIQVFPYWGDGRYYQYTVELSTDGVNWTQVVDMSKNIEPSSMDGRKHVLTSIMQARYVRINMLKNSANIGVHLVEVRIYGP